MKQQVLNEITAPLLYWYQGAARDLPWRREPTPYHVWISEIMLQQTRVEAVKGYYARFLDAFPTVEALAAADDDALNKVWQGLGYYLLFVLAMLIVGVCTLGLGGIFLAPFFGTFFANYYLQLKAEYEQRMSMEATPVAAEYAE